MYSLSFSSTNIDSIKPYFFTRGFIENRYTYKQQQDYLCFDGDFDNDDDDDDDDDDDKIHTTALTTAAADLLLTLINEVPATLPPPPLPLSLFTFSYIDVTQPQTTTSLSTDSDTVTSLSLSLVITTIPCDESGTATLPTTLLKRIISYSLLSMHLLIPSQFIELAYGDNHYCTVSTSKKGLFQRRCTVTKTPTSPVQETPSRRVSLENMNNYLSSFSSLVDIDDDLVTDNPTTNPNDNPHYSSNNVINVISCNWYL